MREIIFRGKRVDNGEWAESPYPYGTMSGGVVRHNFNHGAIFRGIDLEVIGNIYDNPELIEDGD